MSYGSEWREADNARAIPRTACRSRWIAQRVAGGATRMLKDLEADELGGHDSRSTTRRA